jgi:hypothetical protein
MVAESIVRHCAGLNSDGRAILPIRAHTGTHGGICHSIQKEVCLSQPRHVLFLLQALAWGSN